MKTNVINFVDWLITVRDMLLSLLTGNDIKGAWQELKNQSLISDDLSRGVKIAGRDKKTQTSTEHPFFWAPFILIGEWE